MTTTDPKRGATYSETAYTPSPSPTDLASTGTAYPPEVTGGITVEGALIRPFGSEQPPAGVPVPQSYIRASDAVWDASVSRQIIRGINAFLAVENITDEEYDTARTPIRSIARVKGPISGSRSATPTTL